MITKGGLKNFKCQKIHLWTFATKWNLLFQSKIWSAWRQFLSKFEFLCNLQACIRCKHSSIQTFNEMLFAIGRSIVVLVLHILIMAINIVLKKLITWLTDNKMQTIMLDFKNLCKMPSIMGAINGTHISIAKPISVFLKDYYYHKTRGYNIVAQVVVDSKKRFLDVFVGLFRNVNDSYVLRKSKLYQCAIRRGLFDIAIGPQDWMFPYILGDKGYPLFS